MSNQDRTRTRVRATVLSADVTFDYDHRVHVLNVRLDGGGGRQSFQALAEPYELLTLERLICRLFGVNDLASAAGMTCFALYSFGELNEGIEGLENNAGRRVLKSVWWRSLHPGDPSRHDRLLADQQQGRGGEAAAR